MEIKQEIITSRNNPIVKWAASLSDKKGRALSQAFITEGEKLLREAMDTGLPISHIFIAESKKDGIINKIHAHSKHKMYDNTQVYILADCVFEKISTEKAPQGVICAIKYLDFFHNADIIYKEEFFLKKDERALFLHSVRDPGNLGAVIRSAVAFGVDHIILSADSVDPYNPKVVRSAMGSLFKIHITIADDVSFLINLVKKNNRRVFAAELSQTAKSISEVNLNSNDIVIIGNEGHGIPADVSSQCNGSIFIPISGKTESLNASVAAAIFMWEQSK